MELITSALLKSTDALINTLFENTTILITEHNSKGAMGFIINQLFERKLNELEEFKYVRDFPLYNGGPMGQEYLFFIHKSPELIEEGIAIGNGVYSGGNFKQAIEGINNKTITSANIKIFIGYCGWDANELEAEIAEGSWTLEEYNEQVFAL